MAHINGVLVAKTRTFVQAMDFVVAHIRFDHHATDLGAAEQVIHNGAEDLPAKFPDRGFRGRDQNMHAVVVRLSGIVFTYFILAGAIAFDKEGRFTIAAADQRRMRILAVSWW